MIGPAESIRPARADFTSSFEFWQIAEVSDKEERGAAGHLRWIADNSRINQNTHQIKYGAAISIKF
jgi:hypothetical protein